MNKYLVILFIICVIWFIYIIMDPDTNTNTNCKNNNYIQYIINTNIKPENINSKPENININPENINKSTKYATNAPEKDSYLH